MLRYVIAFVVAASAFWIGQADSQSSWQAVRIDGGGFVTGIDIECDQGVRVCTPGVGTVTKVVRTDTAAAWLWDSGRGLWKQLVTRQSFPDAGFGDFYGACEIRISPSNTNHLYLYFTLGAGNKTAGYIFELLNKGATWTRTGFSSVACDAANSGAPEGKQLGFKMGVAPNNDAVLYVGDRVEGRLLHDKRWPGCANDVCTDSDGHDPGWRRQFEPDRLRSVRRHREHRLHQQQWSRHLEMHKRVHLPIVLRIELVGNADDVREHSGGSERHTVGRR